MRKIFTMFYTFFSVFQNRMQETNQRLKLGDINMIEAMKAYWWIMIFPAVIAGMIQRRELPDAKSALKDIAGYWLAAFPFVRDIFSPMITGYKYTMTPVEGAGGSFARMGKYVGTIASGEKVDPRKLVKSATRAAGYAFGLPANQMIITMDGIVDLSSGKTRQLSRLMFSEQKKDKKKTRRF